MTITIAITMTTTAAITTATSVPKKI